MMNIWDKYPTKGTSSERMPKSVPTDEFRMVYYYGRDRDDWREHTFKAWGASHAKERALEILPKGWTLKSVKPIDNQ